MYQPIAFVDGESDTDEQTFFKRVTVSKDSALIGNDDARNEIENVEGTKQKK